MKLFTACALIALFIFSCVPDKRIDRAYLQGKWVVIEASRNQKKTNTLDGAFFYFDQYVLTTNFMGEENQATYELAKDQLKLTKGMDYTFKLQRTADQYLLMTTKIQNTDFSFKLKKE